MSFFYYWNVFIDTLLQVDTWTVYLDSKCCGTRRSGSSAREVLDPLGVVMVIRSRSRFWPTSWYVICLRLNVLKNSLTVISRYRVPSLFQSFNPDTRWFTRRA